jgi:hypothetical protein
MFGLFTPPKKSPTVADEFLKKLMKLSPMTDLVLATLFGVATVVLYFREEKLISLILLCLALFFALLGIVAIQKDMQDFKIVAKNSSPETLLSMHAPQFEAYLMALFRLDGYSVRLSRSELHRLDDADFIATRGKTALLIQFNHFDETVVGFKPIESLCRSAATLRISSAIVVIFGKLTPEAYNYAVNKGITLMTLSDVLTMADRLTGKSEQEDPEPPTWQSGLDPTADDVATSSPGVIPHNN